MFLRGEITFADGFDETIYIRLVFTGCRKASEGHSCLNCHNPELWKFETEGTEEERLKILESQLKDWQESGADVDGVSIIGGEPLDQDPEESRKVLTLVEKYFPGIKFFLYTGFDEEKFFRNRDYRDHPLALKATYIKFGPYVEEMKTPENFRGHPFLGSLNQNIYEVIRRNNSALYKKITVE